MNKGRKEKDRKGKGRGVSRVGLALFHAVGQMAIPPKRGGVARGERQRPKVATPSLPTIDGADESERGEGAVEEEVTDNGMKEEEHERAKEGPELPKEVQNDLKLIMKGVVETYPLHYPSNAEHMISLLMKHPDLSPDARNEMCDAPIHAIMKKKAHTKAERADKMTTLFNLLVYSNANVNATAAYGMTALHMAANACDVECAKVLLAFGAKVDVRNMYKKTPLDLVEGPWRLFSRHDSNHAIGSFLSHDSGSFDLESSESPHSSSSVSEYVDMEYAPDKAKSEFIQLLKSLGAKRGRNWTRLHRARVSIHPQVSETLSRSSVSSESAIAARESLFTEKLMAGINACEEDISRVLSSSDLEHGMSASDAMILAESMQKLRILRKGGSRILCLDGGGMRVLMQAEILAHIQAATGRKIIEMFDWIIGTSMGGVIALTLVYGNTSTFRQLKQIGCKMRTDIFGKGGLSGDVNAVEEMLKEYIPEDICMCDVTYPRVLIAAVNKSSTNVKLDFFNNCFDDEFSTQPVWKVGRYTTAVPVLFTEKDNYVDGGLLANNPAVDAIARIQTFHRSKYGCKLPISLVLSLGTGVQPHEPLGNVDILKSNIFSLVELGKKAQNLISLFGACVSESQRAADVCQSHCQDMGIYYFRINVPLEKTVNMVIRDVDMIVDVLLQARQHLQDNPQLRELALRLNDLATAAHKIHDML